MSSPRSRALLASLAGQGGGAWVPPAGIVAWWRGDADVSAGGAWVDSVGGKTITLAADGAAVSAGVGLAVAAGKSTTMLSDYVQPGGGIGRGVTYAAWYRVIAPAPLVRLLSSGAAAYPITMRGDAGYVYGGTISYLPVVAGAWQHRIITAYWGADALQADKASTVYIDGAIYASPSVGASTADGGAFRLGAVSATWSYYLDDIQIYDRLISDEEAADIYANSPGSHAT